ncbi:hypothetical protein J4420_02015 [Candidatus Woesearchaeota archaeon]|nr:hypothetical protein [Candidatus Woesearchaeota archaeon]
MVPYPEKRPEPRLLDHEINLKINVRSLLRGLLLVFVFLGVFMLGRWSVSPPDLSLDISGVTGMIVAAEDPAAEEPAPAVKENKTATAPVADSPVAETPAVTPTANTSANTTVNTTVAEEGPVVTSYSKVAVSLNRAIVKWFDTWGKVTQLDYTIKNNEAGIIKPSYLLLSVEGYNDELAKRKISLPLSSQSIQPGASVSKVVNVPPQGYAYSDSSTGDLHNVMLTVGLYDSKDTLMGEFHKEFDLSVPQ